MATISVKKLVIILVSIVLSFIICFWGALTFSRGIFRGDSKDFTVNITENAGHEIFQNTGPFKSWELAQREMMIKYMRDNKLKIKPGTYTINTNSSINDVLEIIEFEN